MKDIKVGSEVAFNTLPDATWFTVVAKLGFTLEVREAGTNYASQRADTSMVKQVREKDYLAIIMFTTGSSHARGPNKDEAIAEVQRIFASDWKSLFDVYDKPLKVGVYDVTGHDSLSWDHGGVHIEGGGKVPLLEVVDVTIARPSKTGTR